MSGTNTINGAAGGLITDATGFNVVQLGSAPASVLAALGTDTIVGGTGNLGVYAEGDNNPLVVAAGSGTLVLSMLGGSGTATVTGGAGGETLTGSLGNMDVTQAGALTLHPSNGTITITANGDAITVWASDNSGYEVFTPTAGTTVTVAPTPDGFGHTLVTVGANAPLVLGNGLMSPESNPNAISLLTGSTGSGNVIIPAPPAPVVTGLTAATDTGASSTDGITADATPVVTGSAVAGDYVVLLEGAQTLGGSVADPSGNWSIAVTNPLSNGTHTLTAEVLDISGVTSATSNPLNVVIDTVPPNAPAITGLDPTTDSGTVGDSITNVRNVVIDGTADAGSSVALYDGATLIGTATANGAGTFSVTSTVALTDGQHDLTAVETDLAGLSSGASAVYAVTVQTTPPPAPMLVLDPASDTGTLGDNVTSVTTPIVDGTGLPGDTLTIADGGTPIATTTVGALGTWTYTPTSPLAYGTHVLTATETDVAGNVSTAGTLDLTIQQIAPIAITAVTPVGGALLGTDTNAPNVTLAGTAAAGASLAITDDGGTALTATADATGAWSVTAPVLTGANTFAVTVTLDPLGTTTGSSATTTLTGYPATPTPPTVTGLAPSSDSGNPGDGITDISMPSFTGTGTPGLLVSLQSNGTLVGTGTVDAAGTWTVASTIDLALGGDTITATETDPFGTASAASSPITTQIVPVPTAPPIALLSGGTTTTTTTPDILLQPLFEPSIAQYNFYDNGTPIGIAPPFIPDFIPSAPLPYGNNVITATTTDLYGNVSSASTLDITVLMTSPSLLLAPGSDSGTVGDNLTNVTTPTLDGAAAAGATITVLDNGGTLGTTIADGAGNWSFTTPTSLLTGANTFEAVASLGAGITATSTPLVVTIDTTPPAPPTVGLTAASDTGAAGDGVTTVADPTFTGNVGANDLVSIAADGTVLGTATASAAGVWTFTPSGTLALGTHVITATATDNVGNVSAANGFGLTIMPASVPMPSAALSPASESGLPGSDITNVTTPTLTGTGVAGDIITIDEGTAQLAQASVASDGTWSATLGAPLAAGNHLILVTDVNAGGAASAPASLALTIETAVAAPTLTLAPSSDSGVPGDNLTNVVQPTVIGTTTAGATVAVSDGGTLLGTATADASGAWSYTAPAPLPDGLNAMTAVVTDPAGNVSAPGTLDITIERQAAVPSILAFTPNTGPDPATQDTNAPIITLSGSATPSSTVNITDDGLPVATTISNAAGSWSAAIGLLPGTNTFTANIAADPAGNAGGPSTPFTVTQIIGAPAAPDIIGLTPATDSGTAGDGITNDITPTVTGTAPAGMNVTLFDGATMLGTTTADAGGVWTVALATPLTSGTYALTATATDAAGNVSPASTPYTLQIDTAAPPAPTLALDAASINPVLGATTTDNQTPTLQGTAMPGATVTVTDGAATIGQATAQPDGTWSLALAAPLGLGAHTLTASVTDVAGNQSPAASLAITVDPVPTAIPTIALAPASDSGVAGDGLTNVTEPSLLGTAPAGDVVGITANGTIFATVTADVSGRWSYTPSAPLTDGTYTLLATATDPVSGTSRTSGAYSLQIDTLAPAAPILQSVLGGTQTGQGIITGSVQPDVNGTAAPGDQITLLDGATVLATGTADAAGNWSLLPDTTLAAGTHALTATATDAAGNTSTDATPLDVTVAPEAALQVNQSIPFINAATQSMQRTLGPSWWLGGPATVTYYAPGQTPPPPASGTTLGLLVGDESNNATVGIAPGTQLVSDTAHGATTLLGAGGDSQLVMSTAPQTTYFTGGGSGVYLGGEAAGGPTAPRGNNLVIMPDQGGGNFVVDTGSGNDTVLANSGNNSISAGSGNNWIALGSGNNLVMNQGNDTVDASGGMTTVDAINDTINAAGQGVLVFGGQSTLQFINGAGNATLAGGGNETVYGGSGKLTVYGGSGGGIYYGGRGGNNVIFSGSGASTLTGGTGGNDLLVTKNNQNNLLVASQGSETLFGGQSSGNNIYLGGSGNTEIVAGAGHDTAVMNAGRTTVFSGSGDTTTFAYAPGIVVAGSGNQLIVCGGPSESYGFARGQAGGITDFYNFNPARDHVELWNYGAADLSNALATQTTGGGMTIIRLSDGTQIDFHGMQHVTSNMFSV